MSNLIERTEPLTFRVTMRSRGGEELEIEGDLLICMAAIVDRLSLPPDEAYVFLTDAAQNPDGAEINWPHELRAHISNKSF